MGFKCTLSNLILILFTLKRMLCLGGNICMKAYDVTPFQILFPVTNVSADGWDFPLCLCPCLQVALCIWGWCLEPFSGVVSQTKWVANSVCWYPWLSTASSPSCRPLSKATVCSSCVAWCLALGEYALLFSWIFSTILLNVCHGAESPLRISPSSRLFLCCLASSKHVTRGYCDRMNKPILVRCGGRERTKQKQSVSRN